MASELTEAFTAYLRQHDDAAAVDGLIGALGRVGDAMEHDLLEHFARNGPGAVLVTETTSSFLGRRAWVGPQLPGDAAAGDLWYDTVEAMPMILIPREPHPWPVAKDLYTPLLAWLACRPVMAWQFEGYRAVTGGQLSPDAHDTGPAAGLTYAEAAAYAEWFGKMLSENLTWEAVPHLLPASVIERMWDGLSREWNRLRSDVDESLALVVVKDDPGVDPDDLLRAHEADEGPDPRGRFAISPDTRNPLLGLRSTLPVQFGFVSARPW